MGGLERRVAEERKQRLTAEAALEQLDRRAKQQQEQQAKPHRQAVGFHRVLETLKKLFFMFFFCPN